MTEEEVNFKNFAIVILFSIFLFYNYLCSPINITYFTVDFSLFFEFIVGFLWGFWGIIAIFIGFLIYTTQISYLTPIQFAIFVTIHIVGGLGGWIVSYFYKTHKKGDKFKILAILIFLITASTNVLFYKFLSILKIKGEFEIIDFKYFVKYISGTGVIFLMGFIILLYRYLPILKDCGFISLRFFGKWSERKILFPRKKFSLFALIILVILPFAPFKLTYSNLKFLNKTVQNTLISTGTQLNQMFSLKIESILKDRFFQMKAISTSVENTLDTPSLMNSILLKNLKKDRDIFNLEYVDLKQKDFSDRFKFFTNSKNKKVFKGEYFFSGIKNDCFVVGFKIRDEYGVKGFLFGRFSADEIKTIMYSSNLKIGEFGNFSLIDNENKIFGSKKKSPIYFLKLKEGFNKIYSSSKELLFLFKHTIKMCNYTVILIFNCSKWLEYINFARMKSRTQTIYSIYLFFSFFVALFVLEISRKF